MKRAVTVVGSGPAGLMAADVLSAAGHKVTIIDQAKSPARKFLLAGRGGLNLTHSELLEKLVPRYGEAADFLAPMIKAFPPAAVVKWCEDLGQDTFVGSSGRVFPKAMKASPLLRAWLRRLEAQSVELKSSQLWLGFDKTPTILALGGASWPEMGSDGAWVETFRAAGIKVNDLKASNGRILIAWTEHFKTRFAGMPIKNLELRYAEATAKGEIAITAQGLEGGAIYQLYRAMRDQPGLALVIDLKPELKVDAIAKRLAMPRGRMSQSNFLRKALGLTPQTIALIHEVKAAISGEGIKSLTLYPQGFAGIERAISTAGGVALSELDQNCQLKSHPLTYCVGEMLDFDAPTGGYLLQAAFSTAVAAARDLVKRFATA
ncbi:MAG: TIGR03862 family flavoprotein [Pseudomonadota bacterium]|nr:TIGR03862 family flavoprotein [Pseudomonadota bacterium]